MALHDWHELELFADWRPEEVAVLVDTVTAEVHINQGDVICEDAAVDEVWRWWIVAEGSAIVTASGIPVATIGPGETIGELALLEGGVRSGTVTAATPMVLHELDGDRFVDVLRRAPGLALSLARQLARRLRVANEQVVERNGRLWPSGGD